MTTVKGQPDIVMHFRVMLGGLILAATACNTTSSKIAFSKEEYRINNESVLYVYRNRAFVGGGMETALFFDGKSVGILPQNGYFPMHALAGRHKLRGCSTGFLAPEDCDEIEVDMPVQNFTIVQLVMVMRGIGPRISFVKAGDLGALADNKNEGNYYDSSLRDLLPKSEKKVLLTAATLSKDKTAQDATPLKVAILNFSDQTGSPNCGWLAESLPDAIDQSMRKDFEYARPNPKSAQKIANAASGKTAKQLAADLGTNLVISGSYKLNENKSGVRIEAQIYYADGDKVLGSESVDASLDSQIFNSTKILSDKMVGRLHQLTRPR